MSLEADDNVMFCSLFHNPSFKRLVELCKLHWAKAQRDEVQFMTPFWRAFDLVRVASNKIIIVTGWSAL